MTSAEAAPRSPAPRSPARALDALRADTLALYAVLGPLAAAGAARHAVTAERLAAAERRLREGTLTVVVCGEFKRGKSSLLNALLEEPDLFPRDTYFATSLVTTAAYGPVERVVVTLDPPEDQVGGEPQQVEIPRARIAEFATESGNPGNVKRARLISVRLPNPRLASGLVLVDTPGVGAVYQAHTAVTAGFLPQADALVFVADATQPLTESELRFLSRAAAASRALDGTDGLVFALTKIDTVGDYTAIQANTLAKLAAATGLAPDEVPLVPVSARAKLDFLADGDPEDLEISNFEEFERVLWSALARRRASLLVGGALAELEASARAMLAPVDAELHSLLDETRTRLAELRSDAEERQRRIAELASSEARWRRELVDSVADLGRALGTRAQRELDEVWHRFRTEYLYDEAMLADPDRLVGQLAADAALVTGTVGELAGSRAAELQADFARRNGLELDARPAGGLPEPPVPALAVTGRLGEGERAARGGGRLRAVSSGSGMGTTAGGLAAGAIGAIIGTLVLPGAGTAVGAQIGSSIGSVVGALFGGVAGYRGAVRDQQIADRTARRNSLRTELEAMRAGQYAHLANAVRDLTRTLAEAVRAELESRIAREQAAGRDTLARLAAAQSATWEQATRRAAELGLERRPLTEVRAGVEQLGARLTALLAEAR
ncbi:dynamin family protein [Kitasatospora sp. NPDC093806]|uniref:dynamin family protein n=1 Tax=Kitasatospora sp. NPDC093806 TaxID=3155075 RepID=UPI0034477346